MNNRKPTNQLKDSALSELIAAISLNEKSLPLALTRVALCELQERRKDDADRAPVVSALFISGVRDEDGDCTAVDDIAAQFWTVYRRNEDGTCDALMDFMSRESAETAIKMIAKKRVQTGVDDDVRNIIGLLENNEWAEHCTETVLGSRLEAEITRLVGSMQSAPVVPKKIPHSVYMVIYQECGGFVDCGANAQTIWEACRAAMLKGGAA
ncbi:hypothetical protein [Raoultella sp. HC6]|uniref:hypothetical protein n=1 Tax=Raoultella sp. HC6 TaxID=2923366 RepID=UPI001F514BCB|nr:hypothetical protein [Raoultella sp. HC6]